MHIKSKVYKKTLYVLLCGELDENSALHTRLTLDKLFSGSDFNQIIIDLSELEFMDSTGIGVLIGRYKKMKDKHIPIVAVFMLDGNVDRVFPYIGNVPSTVFDGDWRKVINLLLRTMLDQSVEAVMLEEDCDENTEFLPYPPEPQVFH